MSKLRVVAGRANAVEILWDERCTLVCDRNCGKAFGINGRPKLQLSADEDDAVYLTDAEVGEAPGSGHTVILSEGGHMKPRGPDGGGGKWCARECERSKAVDGWGLNDATILAAVPDFSRRRYNMPWLHKDEVDAQANG